MMVFDTSLSVFLHHVENIEKSASYSIMCHHLFSTAFFSVTFFTSLQERSYCELLVPSRSFFCKPRRQQSEHNDLCDSNERCMHPGVARCFSYEPATHKATAHYVPHTQHSHLDKGRSWRIGISELNFCQ